MVATTVTQRKQIGVGTFRASEMARKLIDGILDTGRISYGPLCKRLEQDFSAIHGRKFGVLSNSGTSSLQVALQAMKELHGWRDGDEVIVPATTFVATVNIVLHNRMKPVLVDIDPVYYEMDPERLSEKISGKTRCAIPVHLFGQPCDMAELISHSRGKDVKWIEDSCETMFVGPGNVLYQPGSAIAGGMGDIGCFSFYVAHLIAAGVGGMSITDNPEYAATMRSIVNHGRDGIYISIDDDSDCNEKQLREIISRRFKFERVGHSFRITEFEAALALAQLSDWPDMLARRQRNANHLICALREHEDRIQLPDVRPGGSHAWMMFPIVMLYESKVGICQYLEEHGIETREMLPLTNQPVYSSWINSDDYPISNWVNTGGFYVGCHQDLSTDDMDYIASVIGDYFKGH